MRRIAFYAALKSPHHTVPSGERTIARNLMALLRTPGSDVDLVSEFRPLDKLGDAALQIRFLEEAELISAKLIAQGGWDAWVSYHSYYKAPDLLGPAVSKALGIPYVSIEATRASKRLGGPWDAFERKAQEACDSADVLFHFTARDAVALKRDLQPGQLLAHLPPFLGTRALPETARPTCPTVLLAGMMRAGDKLASYEIAASALAMVKSENWCIEIAGDGPARKEVEALMAPLDVPVRFLGALDAAGMSAAYGRASAFLWPGVNEAFGMVYLEAQSHGVPVVAQALAGVPEVVDAAGVFAPDRTEALAAELTHLLNDEDHRISRAASARNLVAERHLAGPAQKRIWDALTPLIAEIT